MAGEPRTFQEDPSKSIFTKGYANLYDLLYEEKDYGQECNLLETIFARYSNTPIRTLLDIGCGTGGHALILAERGYSVTGADRSPEMLAILGEKARQRRVDIPVIRSEGQNLNIKQEFDACISMFAVIGYQEANADLEAFIRAAYRHTVAGGLFIFDFWYGPTVLAVRPEERVKVIERNGERIVRTATPHLDSRHHRNSTDYTLVRYQAEKIISEVRERHTMRFFFPLEIEYFLSSNGFDLLQLGNFPNFLDPPTDQTWNTIAIAKRK